MEVHTHTERKRWTHYLWEFLMLFLAVTLGFFVENQREHYVEHQRAQVYMQSYAAQETCGSNLRMQKMHWFWQLKLLTNLQSSIT